MFPDEPGSSSPVAWAHAESHIFWKIKDTHEIVLFDSIDRFDVSYTHLSSAVDFFLDHPACTGEYIFIESCRTAEFYIFGYSKIDILVLGLFFIILLLVRTLGVLVPILLTIIFSLTFIVIFVVITFVIVVVVSPS